MNKRGVTTKRNWRKKKKKKKKKSIKKSTHPWHIDCTSVADRRLFRLVTSLWFWLRLSFFLLGGCHSSVFIAVAVCSAHFLPAGVADLARLNRLFLFYFYLFFYELPGVCRLLQSCCHFLPSQQAFFFSFFFFLRVTWGLSPSPVVLPFSTVSTGFFFFFLFFYELPGVCRLLQSCCHFLPSQQAFSSFYELPGVCRRPPHT